MYTRLIQSMIASFFLVSSTLTFAEPPADLVATTNTTVICGFTDDVLPDQASAAAQAAIQSVAGKGRHVYTTAFRGFSAHMSATAAANLVEHNPIVAFCEQNGLGQTDGQPGQTGAKGGKGKGNPTPATQVTPWGIERVGGPLDGTGRYAWIIDSGIDTDHPDLNVAPICLTDDEKRCGGNFVSAGNGKSKDSVEDNTGHGTHVAGTLAAIDDRNVDGTGGTDVVGVAAGATVIPVRVIHKSGWAAIDDMIAGIDHVAARHGMGDVANMSIWAYGHYKSLHDAALALADRIPFVVIAGNDSEDINERPSEPSHAVHSNLYVVSAIEQIVQDGVVIEEDVFSTGFSNYGTTTSTLNCDSTNEKDPYPCGMVNIAAPGKDVLSLLPGGSLDTWYGTSMAAPHVAGVILATGINPAPTSGTAKYDPDEENDPIVTAPKP